MIVICINMPFSALGLSQWHLSLMLCFACIFSAVIVVAVVIVITIIVILSQECVLFFYFQIKNRLLLLFGKCVQVKFVYVAVYFIWFSSHFFDWKHSFIHAIPFLIYFYYSQYQLWLFRFILVLIISGQVQFLPRCAASSNAMGLNAVLQCEHQYPHIEQTLATTISWKFSIVIQ